MTNIQTLILLSALAGSAVVIGTTNYNANVGVEKSPEIVTEVNFRYLTKLKVSDGDECLLREEPKIILTYSEEMKEYIPSLNGRLLTGKLAGEVTTLPNFRTAIEVCGIYVEKQISSVRFIKTS